MALLIFAEEAVDTVVLEVVGRAAGCDERW